MRHKFWKVSDFVMRVYDEMRMYLKSLLHKHIYLRWHRGRWYIFLAIHNHLYGSYYSYDLSFAITKDLRLVILDVFSDNSRKYNKLFYDESGECLVSGDGTISGLRYALRCIQKLEQRIMRRKETARISIRGADNRRKRAYHYLTRFGYQDYNGQLLKKFNEGEVVSG